MINQSQWALYWICRQEFVDIKKDQLGVAAHAQALPVASWHLNKVWTLLGKSVADMLRLLQIYGPSPGRGGSFGLLGEWDTTPSCGPI